MKNKMQPSTQELDNFLGVSLIFYGTTGDMSLEIILQKETPRVLLYIHGF
jgi:hypothetical protein